MMSAHAHILTWQIKEISGNAASNVVMVKCTTTCRHLSLVLAPMQMMDGSSGPRKLINKTHDKSLMPIGC